MNRYRAAAFSIALALLTFFQFPGHTWLQQDSQIYAAILEHRWDPSVLRNDILVERSHVAYTLYDEAALAARGLTGLGFGDVLAVGQVATRALGIWGLLLLAEAIGLSFWPAATAAAICSLGVMIAGPQVLTLEYEPSPRAFAVPLSVCAMGLAAHRRYWAAGMAGAAAFAIHAPTTLPFWGAYALVARRARLAFVLPLGAAVAVVLLAAHLDSGSREQQSFFAAVTPSEEALERIRTAYCWISTWPAAIILRQVAIFGVLAAACARLWRKLTAELRIFLLVLPLAGVLSMPVSWLLLEHWKWGLMPQVQPMRTLLFGTLAMQLAAAAAAALARSRWESLGWYSLALLPAIPSPLALALAGAMVLAGARFAPAAAAAAFFVIPWIGGVVNYPALHTPELAGLAQWARANTPKDAVFLFPDAGHGLDPGIFRTEALRAVYVDWKGGGQVNYLPQLGEDWWFRWQQTVARGFRPEDMTRYGGLGIQYVVLRQRTAQAPAFANARYAVYRVR
jgi:hypothetical protein